MSPPHSKVPVGLLWADPPATHWTPATCSRGSAFRSLSSFAMAAPSPHPSADQPRPAGALPALLTPQGSLIPGPMERGQRPLRALLSPPPQPFSGSSGCQACLHVPWPWSSSPQPIPALHPSSALPASSILPASPAEHSPDDRVSGQLRPAETKQLASTAQHR